jgi:hypothetical protein
VYVCVCENRYSYIQLARIPLSFFLSLSLSVCVCVVLWAGGIGPDLFLLKAPSLDEYLSGSARRLNQSQYVCDALMAADCAVPSAQESKKSDLQTVIDFQIVESMCVVDSDKARRDVLYARNHAQYAEVQGVAFYCVCMCVCECVCVCRLRVM